MSFDFPEWSADKIFDKTGISERHITADGGCASDIGVLAAQKLFASFICHREVVDYLILCTQTPDYFLPTTACLVQERLGLPVNVGALDISLGCSGYIYGLSLAKGLIATEQARCVRFITADAYSKIHPRDRSIRTLFGNAAAATLLCASSSRAGDRSAARIGPFVFGTDGKGAENLIVPAGGMSRPCTDREYQVESDENGNQRRPANLFMNVAEIFNFTLRIVPKLVNSIINKSSRQIHVIDLFFSYQHTKHLFYYLRMKTGIPSEKFSIPMDHCGNTVSSSIPIALKGARDAGIFQPGFRVVVVGFGVDYSWGPR